MRSRGTLVVLLTGVLWLAALPAVHAAAPPPPPTALHTMAARDISTFPHVAAGIAGPDHHARAQAHDSEAAHGHGHGGPRLRRSAPLRAPIAFSLIGLRVPHGSETWVRTSMDGERWGEWTPVAALSPDEGPDRAGVEPAVARHGQVPTEALWTGPARWLQVQVGGAQHGAVQPVLIDALGQNQSVPQRAWHALRAAWRGAWRGPDAAAQAAQPNIVRRAQWGADESLTSGQPSYARRVHAGFVHHTVNHNDYSREQAPALLRGIHRYHTQSLGWKDIGYHLLVDRFGTVYEGRAGGLDRPVIGAHAGGFNTSTFGIASLGTHSAAGPSAAALEAMAQAIAWKFDVHHIDVAGSVELTSRGSTRYPDGQRVRLPTLNGHRAVSQTSCPGQALESLLPAIRHRVLELGGAMILSHQAQPDTVTVAAGRALDGPVRFSARLRPPGAWTLQVRDPSGRVVHRADGEGEQAGAAWSPPQGSPLGRYDWSISSAGRTTASDYIELVPPVITDAVGQPEVLHGGRTGGFSAPLRVTARLWPLARWQVSVTDPSGAMVQQFSGVGDRLAVDWPGRANLRPGRYQWRISADDAKPVTGAAEVLWPVLTRVGGATDAVGGAVELSKLAFAAGGARHAVVARTDVFADAMVGGPLAGKDGPVLLTASDRLDARVRDELARVLPRGATVYLLGGENALTPAVAEALSAWQVVRLAGVGRVETAARVADEVFTRTGTRRALVARAGPDHAAPWADALAGGAYGAWAGVPVLLTDTDQWSTVAAATLRRHFVTEAIVLGGPSAVSDTVLRQLPSPRRVFGADRAATSVAVAQTLWGRGSGTGGDQWVAANGYAASGWTLALAASPLAARRTAPLLLLSRDSVPPASQSYLERLAYRADRVAGGWLLGGGDSVTGSTADQLSRQLQ